MSDQQPLVSIVTPVYNGERFLAECIKSVLAQTYTRWEYVIFDNCSTDRTRAIAERFAAVDQRIQVLSPEEHLPIMANWNASMRQISPDSAYCKVVHADDMLLPDCLSQMVALGETRPSAGVIGAYRVNGRSIGPNGLAYPQDLFPGDEICRAALLDGVRAFGSPTTTMIRAELVRNRPQFYNEANPHADTEACYELLRTTDFGFIHQVLTYTRTDHRRNSTTAEAMSSYWLGNLHDVSTFGPVYLSQDEYYDLLEAKLHEYYRHLAWCKLHKRDKAFWDYHDKHLRSFGLRLDQGRIWRSIAGLVSDRLLNPKKTLEGTLNRRRRARRAMQFREA